MMRILPRLLAFAAALALLFSAALPCAIGEGDTGDGMSMDNQLTLEEIVRSLTNICEPRLLPPVQAIRARLRNTVIAASGEAYEITVAYDGSEAGIPKDARLEASELLDGTVVDGLSFSDYAAGAESALGLSAGSASYIRLFDIRIVDAQGNKVQPQMPVDVKIELADAESADLSVVHFADGETHGDVMDTRITSAGVGVTAAFSTDGFSVYSIVSSGATANLNGKTFAIVNTYTKNALQAESHSNTRRLKAAAVQIGSGYLSTIGDTEVTAWTFSSVGNGKYRIRSADGRYLNINGTNSSGSVTVSYTPQALNVTAGTGDRSGMIRITNDSNLAINNYSGTTADGFGPYNDSGNNEWFVLHAIENVVLHPVYSADKIDVRELQDAQRVLIYKSIYNDADDAYEDFVIDGSGNLVRAYDKGDMVTLRSEVSPVWVLTVHRDAATGQPNGYYDFYNEETGMYLSPKSDGTLVASARPGVTLNGRRDGEYNSTIEAWDSDHWAWYGYQITETGTGTGVFTLQSGTGADSQAFSFAAYTPTITNELHPVATVDSAAAGITIKMYDFPDRGTITNAVGGDNYQGGNHYNNSGQASMLLSDGFPTFTSHSGASALFTDTYFKGYANNLFLASVYNSTGTYEYNAFNNYAYYQNGSFTVYQEIGTPSNDNEYFYKRGNFYPFNPLDVTRKATNTNQYNGSGDILDALDPTNNGTLYLTDGKNDYFGMTMEFTFMQPKDGIYRGGPMEYEFNGDDDLWIYIDGVKILDIGGVHDALPGKIDFATGNITYGNNSISSSIPKTIKGCFQAANVFPDGSPWDDSKVDDYFKGNTFADFGSHHLNMFYMEHGAGASNLEMRFNLPVIEEGTFTVAKELDGTTQEKFANVYFAMQAFAKDEQENDIPLTHAVYDGTQDEIVFHDNVLINGKTYDNVFYLKPGQVASFKDIDETEELKENTLYYVREIGINTDYYDTVEVNDMEVDEVDIDGTEAPEVDGVYPSSVVTVGGRASVTYTNHVSQKNRNELRITKELEAGSEDDGSTFEFRVLLENADGELVPYSTGNYYIQDAEGHYYRYEAGQLTSNGLTPTVASVAGNNGTIAGIPAGYTVVIKDLLAGTDFYVEEIRNPIGWTLANKTVDTSENGTCDPSTLTGNGWAGNVVTADGQIRLDTDAEVIITNKTLSAQISGRKELLGRLMTEEDRFSFLMELVRPTELIAGTNRYPGLGTDSSIVVQNNALGAFDFNLKFSDADYQNYKDNTGIASFIYKLTELAPETADENRFDPNSSIQYSDQVYYVRVTLSMDGGTLKVSPPQVVDHPNAIPFAEPMGISA